MTREEILSMEPGIRLDSMVAENVMGFRFEEYGKIDAQYPCVTPVDDGLIFWASADKDGRIFSPSTDIAAAWEVVEKLTSDGYKVVIGYDPRLLELQWTVLMGHLFDSEKHEVKYDAVQEAICKAALLTTL